MSVEQYARLLDAISERAARMTHQCEVYDIDRMEHYRNPALPCARCDIERILEQEPPA